jgi:hypothetical protein
LNKLFQSSNKEKAVTVLKRVKTGNEREKHLAQAKEPKK